MFWFGLFTRKTKALYLHPKLLWVRWKAQAQWVMRKHHKSKFVNKHSAAGIYVVLECVWILVSSSQNPCLEKTKVSSLKSLRHAMITVTFKAQGVEIEEVFCLTLLMHYMLCLYVHQALHSSRSNELCSQCYSLLAFYELHCPWDLSFGTCCLRTSVREVCVELKCVCMVNLIKDYFKGKHKPFYLCRIMFNQRMNNREARCFSSTCWPGPST